MQPRLLSEHEEPEIENNEEEPFEVMLRIQEAESILSPGIESHGVPNRIYQDSQK